MSRLLALLVVTLSHVVVCSWGMISRRIPYRQGTTLLHMSGLFGEPTNQDRRVGPIVNWQIYVDQSKASLDRGASTTLDAFCSLSPPNKVQIVAAILPKSNKKTPWVRCISKIPGRSSIDVANVDSVDKVYRILTKHLQIQVSRDACSCLKWKYKGNGHMEAGKVNLAIDAYNKAIEKCIVGSKQEGVILLQRASAYSKQAQSHQEALQEIVQDWRLPDRKDIQFLLSEALVGGPERTGLACSILNKLQGDGKRQQAELRKIQYRHGLYQYALLHATQDALRATELLPSYSVSWLRAGELLSQLWKLKESKQYYDKALSLDPNLASSLESAFGDLKRRQYLLEQAKASKDWPEDSLRLALDVAG